MKRYMLQEVCLKYRRKHMARKGEIKRLETVLRDYAMSFPGATEDFPWGERVIKVNKKVFVFLGKDQAEDFSMSVKLPQSLEEALALPFTEPTGYGLGKHGWVFSRFDPGSTNVSEKLLKGWIEESYRAVAPAKLIDQLEGKAPSRKKTKQ